MVSATVCGRCRDAAAAMKTPAPFTPRPAERRDK